MTITADDTLSEIETTKGKYKVNGNILIYERINQKNHDSNNWIACEQNSETSERIKCGSIGDNLAKTESFIIDIQNKKLYSTNYIGSSLYGYGPIALDYTNQ